MVSLLLVHSLSFRSPFAGPVLTQNEGTRYHSHCHPTKQTVDVLIGHCRRLLIERLVNLSSCHKRGPRPLSASTEVSGQRIGSTDEGEITGLHLFLQMRLVKKRAVGNDRSGDGDENAAANIADEIDNPRNLVTRFFRKSDIGRICDGDECERNRKHLKNSQPGSKTEGHSQSEVR